MGMSKNPSCENEDWLGQKGIKSGYAGQKLEETKYGQTSACEFLLLRR